MSNLHCLSHRFGVNVIHCGSDFAYRGTAQQHSPGIQLTNNSLLLSTSFVMGRVSDAIEISCQVRL